MTEQDTSTTQAKYSFSVLEMGQHEYPEFKEVRGKDHIQFGEGDLYPNYLHELYSTSSAHGAIVNAVAEMIAGDGLMGEAGDFYLNASSLFKKCVIRDLSHDLKLSGNAYILGIWNQARTKVTSVECLPYHTVRAGIKENGDITHYFYSETWDKKTKGERIAAYNPNSTEAPKFIYHIRRPDTQSSYYGTPDYLGCTSYIELDKELGQFHLNNVKNGLFPGLMFNFMDGEPDEQQKRELERDIKSKFGGAQGAGSFMMFFNHGNETAPTVTPIETSGNHEMFQTLAENIDNKILTGHGVTSPLLFGLRGSTGFGSNSEELRVAYELFYHNRVKPMQRLILEAIKDIAGQGSGSGEVDIIPNVPDGIQLAKVNFAEVAGWLIEQGEEVGEDWEEVVSHKVDYDLDEELNVEMKSVEQGMNFARTVRSEPGKNSDQDTSIFKIRYRYKSTNDATHSSREFCRRMIAANKIYRKEDIEKAGGQAVNPGWGPGGANTYDIWLYKGGGDCQHFWERVIYLKSGGEISPAEATKMILALPVAQRAAAKWQINDTKVSTAPRNQTNRGFLTPR